jgi:hypothetical protein
MKKASLVLLLALSLLACSDNKKDVPDISKIKVNIAIERFDQDFFALDTNNLWSSLAQLGQKYPGITPLFLTNILGIDSMSSNAESGIRSFIQLSKPIRDTVNDVFKNTNDIEKDFETAFRYVKYYFPKYEVPKVVTIVGPVDALAQSSRGPTPDFLRPGYLGISLQFYLGSEFSIYRDPYFIENVAPAYRTRRFSPEYIIADGMQLITDDLFPDKSAGRPLIEQMIERGKQWWLLDKFLPEKPDSIKTGFTPQQLDWCNKNEGLIWNHIIKNEDLYSINPATIQTYIGEGPFTQGMSQEYSPGNIGQWIGWQIIKKYESNNPGITPEALMNTPAQKILDGAKYRPK